MDPEVPSPKAREIQPSKRRYYTVQKGWLSVKNSEKVKSVSGSVRNRVFDRVIALIDI